MNQHILFVTKNETTSATRFCANTLRDAGFRVFLAESLGRAVAVAFSLHPDLVILEQTFAEQERTAFINCLHESRPEIRVLYLQDGETGSDLLLKCCQSILSAQPGGRRVHSDQEFVAQSA